MATSKKGSKKGSRKGIRPGSPSVFQRGSWKRSWNVLWGFLAVVGELILIFLVKGRVVSLSVVQLVVLFICIPIGAHLLVSALRSILIAVSSR